MQSQQCISQYTFMMQTYVAGWIPRKLEIAEKRSTFHFHVCKHTNHRPNNKLDLTWGHKSHSFQSVSSKLISRSNLRFKKNKALRNLRISGSRLRSLCYFTPVSYKPCFSLPIGVLHHDLHEVGIKQSCKVIFGLIAHPHPKTTRSHDTPQKNIPGASI